jgi:hypothetical protein
MQTQVFMDVWAASKREKQVDRARFGLLGWKRERKTRPAAFERAAAKPRGSWVLVVHEI